MRGACDIVFTPVGRKRRRQPGRPEFEFAVGGSPFLLGVERDPFCARNSVSSRPVEAPVRGMAEGV